MLVVSSAEPTSFPVSMPRILDVCGWANVFVSFPQIKGEQAEFLVNRCPMKVYDIEDLGKCHVKATVFEGMTT